jgi:hypothetical protein
MRLCPFSFPFFLQFQNLSLAQNSLVCHLPSAICHDHDREMWLATTVQAWTRFTRGVLSSTYRPKKQFPFNFPSIPTDKFSMSNSQFSDWSFPGATYHLMARGNHGGRSLPTHLTPRLTFHYG